jgi:septum formation protein
MLILASASPRRQDLLRSSGILFHAQPADIDETPLAGESPRGYAERLAREKALAIFRSRPQDFVLGADTIVVIDDKILGKPRDVDDAMRMLRFLSGRTHAVITGVCLAGPGASARSPVAGKNRERIARPTDWEKTTSETTLVTMCEVSEEEIREYVATGEPMDKAGAYAIQGMASRWIPKIEGDYSNVVGLPVAMVYAMLRERGAV